MTTRSFSNSEIQTWKRCKRKWWLSVYRRLRPHTEDLSGAAALGTRVHYALRMMYDPETQADPLETLNAGIAHDVELYPDEAADINKDGDLARAILQGYLEWLSEEGVDSELEIIGPEQELAVEVTEMHGFKIVLVAKLDLRVRRVTDGLMFFLDHKTVGSLTEPLKTLHMNDQMKHYMLIERLHSKMLGQEGENVAGGLYNMLKKSKRTDRAKPPFYARHNVIHNDHVLRTYWSQLMGTIDQILRAERQLDAGADHQFVVPPTQMDRCTWDCVFFPVCHMLDDGSNVERFLESAYAQGDPYDRYETVEMRTE